MKTYTITVTFTTDAEPALLDDVAQDMLAQLETLEDEHGAKVSERSVGVERQLRF